ncbi:MAG: hypothetical protein ABIH89_10990 [Elusimicrobiota bacterium]
MQQLKKDFHDAGIHCIATNLSWSKTDPYSLKFGFTKAQLRKQPVIILEDRNIWFTVDALKDPSARQKVVDMYRQKNEMEVKCSCSCSEKNI